MANVGEGTRRTVIEWLQKSPDRHSRFDAGQVSEATGLHRVTAAQALKELYRTAEIPGLTRINRVYWTVSSENGTGPEKLRIVREPAVLLKPGTRLEVTGADFTGIIIARDSFGRMWEVIPLEVHKP